MTDILLKIRHYPWQISDAYTQKYTHNDLLNKDCIEIKYTGGVVLEISHSLLNCQKDFEKNYLIFPLDPTASKDALGLFNLAYYVSNDKNNDASIKFANKKIAIKLTNVKAKNENNLKALEHYLSYFDELMHDSCMIFSDDVYPNLIELIGDGREKPRYSFIASIAPELLKILPSLFLGLRKILVGRRQMMPISRVKELDAPCIRHLIKQPGESIQEKTASNDFKMLAVARVENFDLLENRVLKDFVLRAKKACRAYIDEYREKGHFLKNSVRVQQVRSLLLMLNSFSNEPVFKLISAQRSLPAPNYVLQNERRYRIIWKYYLSLVRRERQLEKAFIYQDNTFKDIGMLFLQCALYSLAQKEIKSDELKIKKFGSSFLSIAREQFHGHRLSSDCLGPFIIISKKSFLTYLVSIETYNLKKKKIPQELGTTSFIKVYCVTEKDIDDKRSILIPIYIVNSAQAYDIEDIDKIFENMISELDSVGKNILIDKYLLGGILISSSKDKPCFKVKDKYVLFSLSINPIEWGEYLEKFRENLYEYLRTIL